MGLAFEFLTPLILGIVLVVSGFQKLKTPDATVQAVTAFGMPPFVRNRVVASSFAAFEVIVGALLLASWGTLFRVSTFLAATLFVFFAAIVADVIRRRKIVECNCFGGLSTAAINYQTLIRNLLLASGALLLAFGWTSSTGTVDALRKFSSEDAWWLIATALCAGLFLTQRRLERVREAQENRGLTKLALDESGNNLADLSGQRIPNMNLKTSAGESVDVRDIPLHRAHLMIFVSPGCHACQPVFDLLPVWRARLATSLSISLVTSTNATEFREYYPLEAGGSFYDEFSDLSARLDLPGVPCGVLLGINGMIGAGPAVGAESIQGLLQAIEEAARVST